MLSLKKCIRSIENQSFNNFEVWVIDGASTDGTIDYLKTLSTPINWISENDNGIYEAMNKGIEFAKGDWFYFLGSDDELFQSDTLEIVFNELIDGVDFISGNVKYDSNKKIPFLKGVDKTIKRSSWSYLIWIRNSLHHQATFYKKEIFSHFRYSTKYKILSDYELNIILFKKGVKCQLINEVISLCGSDGVSKNYNWNLYKEEIEIKTKQSSKILKPIIFLNSYLKFLQKKSL